MRARYEPASLTPLGTLSSPLEPNLSAEKFSFGCTAIERPGGPTCGETSPETQDVRQLRELAIAAGWRLSGSDEPELFNGEALCPRHTRCSIVDVIARYPRPREGSA
jgi:hypothetical protein